MCSAAGYASGGTCTPSDTNKATMEGLINLAVAETNKAYQLSNISTRLRLVKTHYDDTYNDYKNQWETTLSYIRNNGDGQLDYVHAMRDQYGADFVNIIVDTGSYCGIGYRPATPTAGDAFSVTQWSCATGYYSFGHEIAHNMGCNHDRANAGSTSGTNYGYQAPNGALRTIMAYDCPGGCPRIQYFSTPSVTYNGQSLGNAITDNAQQIRNNLSAFANYRQSVAVVAPQSAPTPAPIAVAVPQPAPTRSPIAVVVTGPPTNQLSLQTVLTGGLIGAAGNMFDVRAKTDLKVTNFAMHAYAATTVTIEVYMKKTVGTCVGTQKDSSQWQRIGQATFVSKGAGVPTILPTGTFPPVSVKAGDIQAFYITFKSNTNYNRYSPGNTLGKVQSSNADLDVLEGYAKGYLFGDDYFPRIWNGIVFYERGTTQQTGGATPAPTNKPTFEPAVLPAPTPSPVQPTPAPTIQPSPAPVPASIASGAPINSQQAPDKLTTTFAGGNGQAGNMVEIVASQNIVVTALDIHTYSTQSVHVFVYMKKGTYVGFEQNSDAWTAIADTWVEGKGSPNPTKIPAKDVIPVPITAGETYSFYITLTESSIRYTNGAIAARDGAITFVRSSGNKYPFGASYPNRIWNGILYYTQGTVSRTTDGTPVNKSGPSKQIQTTFENGNGSYGSMFDVQAKEDLVINNIWVHTYQQLGTLVEIEVYKLKTVGSFLGSELDSSKWEKVGGAVVEGKGTGYATKLPPGSINEITVPKGQKQALYVTAIGGGLRYTKGKSVTTLEVYVENDDIKIFEGAGVGAPRFGATFTPRVFNGVLEYYTPNVNSVGTSSGDQATGQYDKITELKDEGWPCTSPDECNSSKCGRATLSETDTLSIGTHSKLEDNSGSRQLRKGVFFCLDNKGEHYEDGDGQTGVSRL
jgi:Metallo-peptidase family M12